MSGFQAWHIEDLPVDIPIATSPIGRLRLLSWPRASLLTRVPEGGSACILPTSATMLMWSGFDAFIVEGCYAQVPGGARLGGGAGLIIHMPDYVGLPQIGGPVEARGRLRYIDGCSDTLLICPALIGEPCLNLLHLPAGTEQTRHTHPSDRIGIILRGRGICRTPEGETVLTGGMFWHIPAEHPHSFHTAVEDLDVLAWHPDSDFGPSHDAHPMVNRTIVEGVPANDERHRGIRTTE